MPRDSSLSKNGILTQSPRGELVFCYATEVGKDTHVLSEVRAGVHPAFCAGMSGARRRKAPTQAPHACLGDSGIAISLCFRRSD